MNPLNINHRLRNRQVGRKCLCYLYSHQVYRQQIEVNDHKAQTSVGQLTKWQSIIFVLLHVGSVRESSSFFLCKLFHQSLSEFLQWKKQFRSDSANLKFLTTKASHNPTSWYWFCWWVNQTITWQTETGFVTKEKQGTTAVIYIHLHTGWVFVDSAHICLIIIKLLVFVWPMKNTVWAHAQIHVRTVLYSCVH